MILGGDKKEYSLWRRESLLQNCSAKECRDLHAFRPINDAKVSLCLLFLTEGITDHDLDSFVDMYREHCEVGILL